MNTSAPACRPGRSFPLGPSLWGGGTNFAVASEVANGITLCLLDDGGNETRVPLLDYDAGVWHTFVPGIGAGQAYGYRATGPYQPSAGIRCNEAKLLLDPYARAVTGVMRDGPSVLGYAGGDPDTPSDLDSPPTCRTASSWTAATPGSRTSRSGAPTRTRSSTRCTSRASPCGTPACRKSFAVPTPGSGTRPPSST